MIQIYFNHAAKLIKYGKKGHSFFHIQKRNWDTVQCILSDKLMITTTLLFLL